MQSESAHRPEETVAPCSDQSTPELTGNPALGGWWDPASGKEVMASKMITDWRT